MAHNLQRSQPSGPLISISLCRELKCNYPFPSLRTSRCGVLLSWVLLSTVPSRKSPILSAISHYLSLVIKFFLFCAFPETYESSLPCPQRFSSSSRFLKQSWFSWFILLKPQVLLTVASFSQLSVLFLDNYLSSCTRKFLFFSVLSVWLSPHIFSSFLAHNHLSISTHNVSLFINDCIFPLTFFAKC